MNFYIIKMRSQIQMNALLYKNNTNKNVKKKHTLNLIFACDSQ